MFKLPTKKNATARFLAFLAWCFAAMATHAQQADIQQLKNEGVVLVRLPTQKAKIKALEDLGKLEEAATLKAELAKSHGEIAQVFREKFTFCPVLFFYAENSGAIADSGPAGFLMDATLNPVDLAPNYFIVAEFNRSPEKGISGLVAYDMKMVPLKHPFPNFVRNHTFFYFWGRTKGAVVSKWNTDLMNFYDRHQKKK